MRIGPQRVAEQSIQVILPISEWLGRGQLSAVSVNPVLFPIDLLNAAEIYINIMKQTTMDDQNRIINDRTNGQVIENFAEHPEKKLHHIFQ